MSSNPGGDKQDAESGGRVLAADQDQLLHTGAAGDARHPSALRWTDGKVSDVFVAGFVLLLHYREA